jgi:uncharacterized protein (DUF1778 family)
MTSREDRFKSIGSQLKPRKPVASAVPDTQAERPPAASAAVSREPTTTSAPSSKRKAQPKSGTKKSDAAGTRRRITFRFKEDLFQALDARARADGTSRVHVVLDAIEKTVGDDMVGQFSEDSPPVGSLFVRPRSPGGVRPTVACELAVDAGTVATIDELAATRQAPTRTAFVVRCIAHYLGLDEN